MRRKTGRTAAAALILAGGITAVPAGPVQAEEVLLSAGRPAAASSSRSAADGPARAVDGDAGTRWVSRAGGAGWITIDLGESAELSRIVLEWGRNFAGRYEIELSDDGASWRDGYVTECGNGGTDDVPVAGRARYVRLSVTRAVTRVLTGDRELREQAAPNYELAEFEIYRDTEPAVWTQTWGDDFDGPAGTPPDPARWTHGYGGNPLWGNNEWQFYTRRPENVGHDGNGHLAITARREPVASLRGQLGTDVRDWLERCENDECKSLGDDVITSGRINTKDKFEQAYGRFEARIKVPGATGFLPAFWAMGGDDDWPARHWPDNGEIDIMEYVHQEPDRVHGTVHGPNTATADEWDSLSEGCSTPLPGGGGVSAGFHTFAVEWSPKRIVWLLDGAAYFSVGENDLHPDARWLYDHPFYLLLNLAAGGDWPGPVTQGTRFPTTMLVDHVRVYARS